MFMIPTTCPACGKTTNCPDELAGGSVPCSGCGTPLTVGSGGLGGFGAYGGYGAQPGPAKKKSSGSPWFFQWWVLALGGIVALGLVAGIVVLISPKPQAAAVADEPADPPSETKKETKSTEESDDTPDDKPAQKPAARKGLAILPIPDITLDPGGTAKITVKVERGGEKGPIPIQIEEPPGQVTIETAEIPEDQDSVVLSLTAEPEAQATTEPVKFTLMATAGEKQAQQQVALVIKPPAAPVFSALPPLTLRPGASATLELKIDRKGYAEPITLITEGLPEKVTITRGGAAAAAESTDEGASEAQPDQLVLAENESSLKLTIAAAADAAEGQSTPKIAATVREQRVEAPLKLTIERFAVRLRPLPVITLKPGESKTLDVAVERRSYNGPLKLVPEGLPEKITANTLDVPAGQTKAQLQLAAATDAPEQIASAALAGSAGGLNLKEVLVVRVASGEGSFLPAETPADSELARLLKRGPLGSRLETAGKETLMKIYGGSEQSEAAVLQGLAWLAKRQAEDGHWEAVGSSETPSEPEGGEAQPTPAADPESYSGGQGGVTATALGVLPFLGAGITHKQSPSEPAELKEYRSKVEAALRWLGKQQVVNREDLKQDGQLPGGITAHAIATLAICEAYALSEDNNIRIPAQRAVRHILQSQHREGGFSDDPNRPGDVTATVWAVLALRSGQTAGLPLDKAALEKAGRFLNACAAGPGDSKLARYARWPDQEATPLATAAGLLARQHIGWERSNSNLSAGSQYLLENRPPEWGDALGPATYYFFATQVLHHLEGPQWDEWNHRMREHLVRTQEKSDAEAGSWNPAGGDELSNQAGRVSATSLALLTLQEYYRHLPLYKRSVKVVSAK
jgi:hypothetical protein